LACHGKGEKMATSNKIIEIHEIKNARSVFEANEPRDLFYRAATELVRLAVDNKTSLSVADALAVLLRTWNSSYYRFRKPDVEHFKKIDLLYRKHRRRLISYRNRTIENLREGERPIVCDLFREFERVIGAVGATKALHLLAPMFFPLWDRAIAQAYGNTLHKAGTNGPRYWQFMVITRRQCLELKGNNFDCGNILKRIDEYNYCKFTKRWKLKKVNA
jgi:hypothetical protein